MKWLEPILLVAGILTMVLLSFYAGYRSHQSPATGELHSSNGPATSNPPVVTPKAGPISISDWQQFLKDEGYECEPDGLLGKQTQKAWDEWYMNESGIYWQEKE